MEKPGDEAQARDAPGGRVGETSCDVCGSPTYELRCKIICRRCGFTRDCSDP